MYTIYYYHFKHKHNSLTICNLCSNFYPNNSSRHVRHHQAIAGRRLEPLQHPARSRRRHAETARPPLHVAHTTAHPGADRPTAQHFRHATSMPSPRAAAAARHRRSATPDWSAAIAGRHVNDFLPREEESAGDHSAQLLLAKCGDAVEAQERSGRGYAQICAGSAERIYRGGR